MDLLMIIIIIFFGIISSGSSEPEEPIITTAVESNMNQEITTSPIMTTIKSDDEQQMTTTRIESSSINTDEIIADLEPVDDTRDPNSTVADTTGCLTNQTIKEIEKIVEKILMMKLSTNVDVIDDNNTETLNVKNSSSLIDSISSIDLVTTTTIVPIEDQENITEKLPPQLTTNEHFQMKLMNRTRVQNIAAASANIGQQWFSIWIWLLLLQFEIILIALIAICIVMRKNFVHNNGINNDDGNVRSICKYNLAFDNDALIIDPQQSSNNSVMVNENCSFQTPPSRHQPPEIQRQRPIPMNVRRNERYQRKLSEPLSETEKSSSSSGAVQYWLCARPNTPNIMKNKIVVNECRL